MSISEQLDQDRLLPPYSPHCHPLYTSAVHPSDALPASKAILRRDERYWVSVYHELACRHEHLSSLQAVHCCRHRRRDEAYDRAARDPAGPVKPLEFRERPKR